MSDKNDLRIGANRTFLNEPFMTSLTSNISYIVKVSTWKKELQDEGLYSYAKIDFAMSDCSRTIHLDFDIQDKDDMRNSLFKLDAIINTCQAMKEDLKKARKVILVGQARLKEIEAEGNKDGKPKVKNELLQRILDQD